MSTVHKIIYSCEEATQLVIKKAEGKLTMMQRLRIWMHLKVCDACKRFDLQNQWLDKQLHQMAHQPIESKLTEAQKLRIAKEVDLNK